MRHIHSWLRSSGRKVRTLDGKEVELFDFQHQDDDCIITEWANHFRSHYCEDRWIDELRDGCGLSRKEYLEQLVFPDKSEGLGPSVRAGDFGEVLVADYIEFALTYYVPRTRYQHKISRNESAKGTDIIGFKVIGIGQVSPLDELVSVEVKCALASLNNDTMINAIAGSDVDYKIRRGESLNAIKRSLINSGNTEKANLVKRFQNRTDKPYKEISGSAVVHSNHTWEDTVITAADTRVHSNSNLILIAIRGEDMMNLVHKLYKKACDAA